jgi:hypothetical protein
MGVNFTRILRISQNTYFTKSNSLQYNRDRGRVSRWDDDDYFVILSALNMHYFIVDSHQVT